MEVFKKNRILSHLSGVWLILTMSCSSGKDMYQNPYQDKSRSLTIYSTASGQQQKQPPEWIYAVSSDFYVGYGQGTDVIEAKNAAFNDIKKTIISALGEFVEFSNIVFVNNTIGGRNIVSSSENFSSNFRSQNAIKTSITLPLDRVEGYYWTRSGLYAEYYIRYRINSTDIQNIREQYDNEKNRSEAESKRIRHSVDSIMEKPIASVESIIDKYNSLCDYLDRTAINRIDSSYIVTRINRLKQTLNSAEIRHTAIAPGLLKIGLYCDGTLMKSSFSPEINAGVVEIKSIKPSNNLWEVRYNNIQPEGTSNNMEVVYELPFKRIREVIRIALTAPKPDIELSGGIILTDIQRNYWNGNVKNLNVKFSLIKNAVSVCTLTGLEIKVNLGDNVWTITFENGSRVLVSANNNLKEPVSCNVSYSHFLNQEITGEMIIYYTTSGNSKKIHFNNIPVKIE